jgi:outer membrane protein OmpA-like peptidoglycan-associated protein
MNLMRSPATKLPMMVGGSHLLFPRDAIKEFWMQQRFLRRCSPFGFATLACFAFICAQIVAWPAHAADVAGSHDYPGIGRFKSSVITGYQTKDFDAARFQAAPFADGKSVKPLKLEGKIARIAYRIGPGPSILEVSRNFEMQLAKAGFEELIACDVDACGGIPFSEAIDGLPAPLMWVDGFNYHYYAAHKAEGGRDTYASILVSKNNDDIYALLVVAQVGGMDNKMVDAAAMAKGLGDEGHIALYGIYFDTDKAVVKPESKPTLDEIAKLLRGQPQLNVVIVGHTDSQGAYDYNMDLSRRRAEAVAAELIRQYRIARPRLRTAGVGFLAPVGSNASEDGRALNRRVELVAP